jgi:hypothetical protein
MALMFEVLSNLLAADLFMCNFYAHLSSLF